MKIIESATNINKGLSITFENGCRAFVSRLNGHIAIALTSNKGKTIRPNTKLDTLLRHEVKRFIGI